MTEHYTTDRDTFALFLQVSGLLFETSRHFRHKERVAHARNYARANGEPQTAPAVLIETYAEESRIWREEPQAALFSSERVPGLFD